MEKGYLLSNQRLSETRLPKISVQKQHQGNQSLPPKTRTKQFQDESITKLSQQSQYIQLKKPEKAVKSQNQEIRDQGLTSSTPKNLEIFLRPHFQNQMLSSLNIDPMKINRRQRVEEIFQRSNIQLNIQQGREQANNNEAFLGILSQFLISQTRVELDKNMLPPLKEVKNIEYKQNDMNISLMGTVIKSNKTNEQYEPIKPITERKNKFLYIVQTEKKQQLALKKLLFQKFEDINRYIDDLRQLSILRQPHATEIKDFFFSNQLNNGSNSNKEVYYLNLLFDIADYSLQDIIVKHFYDDLKILEDQEVFYCIRDCVNALEHMHEKRVAHCNLKPNNILYSEIKKQYVLTFGFERLENRNDEQIVNYLMIRDIQDLGFCMLSLLKKFDYNKMRNDKRLKNQVDIDKFIDDILGKQYNQTTLFLVKQMCRVRVETIPNALVLKEQIDNMEKLMLKGIQQQQQQKNMLNLEQKSTLTTYLKYQRPTKNDLIFYYCILSSVLYIYNIGLNLWKMLLIKHDKATKLVQSVVNLSKDEEDDDQLQFLPSSNFTTDGKDNVYVTESRYGKPKPIVYLKIKWDTEIMYSYDKQIPTSIGTNLSIPFDLGRNLMTIYYQAENIFVLTYKQDIETKSLEFKFYRLFLFNQRLMSMTSPEFPKDEQFIRGSFLSIDKDSVYIVCATTKDIWSQHIEENDKKISEPIIMRVYKYTIDDDKWQQIYQHDDIMNQNRDFLRFSPSYIPGIVMDKENFMVFGGYGALIIDNTKLQGYKIKNQNEVASKSSNSLSITNQNEGTLNYANGLIYRLEKEDHNIFLEIYDINYYTMQFFLINRYLVADEREDKFKGQDTQAIFSLFKYVLVASNKQPETNKIGEYKILEEIGKGAEGKVVKAQHYATGQIVAIKQSQVDDFQSINRIAEEAKVMCEIDYKDITKLYGFFFTKEINGIKLNIVMEIAQTSLHREIRDRKKSNQQFEFHLLFRLMYRVLGGLVYLHSRYIAHKDIKPANVLKFDELHYKLADFGGSEKQALRVTNELVGTLNYASPTVYQAIQEELEIEARNTLMLKQPKKKAQQFVINHDYKLSDVFSCGLTLLESAGLQSTKGLNACRSQIELGSKLQVYMKENKLDQYPEIVTKLLEGMLMYDEMQRLTSKEAFTILKNYREASYNVIYHDSFDILKSEGEIYREFDPYDKEIFFEGLETICMYKEDRQHHQTVIKFKLKYKNKILKLINQQNCALPMCYDNKNKNFYILTTSIFGKVTLDIPSQSPSNQQEVDSEGNSTSDNNITIYQIEELPFPILDAQIKDTSLIFYNRKVIIVGGRVRYAYKFDYTDTCFAYTPETRNWEGFPSLNEKKAQVTLIEAKGCLYAIGGDGQDEFQYYLEKYDPEENKWIPNFMKIKSEEKDWCQYPGVIYLGNFKFLTWHKNYKIFFVNVRTYKLTEVSNASGKKTFISFGCLQKFYTRRSDNKIIVLCKENENWKGSNDYQFNCKTIDVEWPHEVSLSFIVEENKIL